MENERNTGKERKEIKTKGTKMREKKQKLVGRR